MGAPQRHGTGDKLVFFDIETGGLEVGRPITQVAAVACDQGTLQELGHFEVKVVVDEAECTPEALELSSYDRDTWLAEAVDRGRAARELAAFFKMHATVEMTSRRGTPYHVAQLVGHNAAAFDMPHLMDWYRRAGLFLPAAFRVLDTLQLALWTYLGRDDAPPDFKLGTLARHLGADAVEEEAHDALVDACTTVEVARRMPVALRLWATEVGGAPD